MTDSGSVLDINTIIGILPHKPPSTLIDQVIEVEPGGRILTRKNVTVSEQSFAGHFPGMPMLPGSVIIECMVQSCCLLAYATERYDLATKVVSMMGINKMKFHRVIIPGDIMEIECNLTRKRSNVWRFEVKAYKGDILVADGALVLSIQSRGDAL